ncbi:MAG: ATP-binding protein, partial [Anaerolineae bacterium]|nr:ATP-binding protein [Anaerolineae bacterium]
ERAYVIQLLGPDSESKRLVAYHAAAEAGRTLHRVAAAWLPRAVSDLETLARLWQREDQLAPVALLLEAADVERASDTAALVDRLLRRSSGLIFLDTHDVWTGLDETVALVDVTRPTPDEQYAAWREALGDDETCAARLAGQFNLGVSRIHRLARAAEGTDAQACDRVWRAALAGSRPRLDALAQRLDARATWDDIALPQMQEEQLRLIAGQVPHRRQVYDVWGFRDKMNRGLGISALFTGDSGTGKTMAAEVIANDLNLNLYRIDLSQVVSKYIGETEKNLRRVFDAAEDGGAILFFDEADALFGKRSEVKDSHDRYANIEINYLLQRMESYGGLAILATNMKSALDTAFLRRLRFIVNFPFPGPAERRRIWQRALPPQTPHEDLDYDFLARLNLTGGSIHNAALNATFLAAQEGNPDQRRVTMDRLLTAVRMELRKDGRAVNESELKWTPRPAPTAPRKPAVGTPG